MVLQDEHNWRLSFATYPNAALYIPEGSDEILFRTTSRKKKKSKGEISKLENTIQFRATDNNNNEINVKTVFADANTQDCFTKNDNQYENKFNIKLKKAGEKQKQTRFQMRIKSNTGEPILTRHIIAHEFYMETKYKVQTRQLKNMHSILIPVSNFSSIIVELFYDTDGPHDKISQGSLQNQNFNHESPIDNIVHSVTEFISRETPSEQIFGNNLKSGEDDYDFSHPFSPNTLNTLMDCFDSGRRDLNEVDALPNQSDDTSNESESEKPLAVLIDQCSSDTNNGESNCSYSMDQIGEVVSDDVNSPANSCEIANDSTVQLLQIHQKENKPTIENKKNEKVFTEPPVTPHINRTGLSPDEVKKYVNFSVSIGVSSSSSRERNSKKRKSENDNDNENNSLKKRKIEGEENKEEENVTRHRELLQNYILKLSDAEVTSLYHYIFKKN